MRNNIGASINFKEYVYRKYGFWNHNFYDHSFKSINASIEEPIFSTSLSKEEEEGTKGKDSSKPFACSIFLSLFGFSSNRVSKGYDMSTNKGEEVSR